MKYSEIIFGDYFLLFLALKGLLLWPALAGLNSKQRQHGSGDIVIVEVLIIPYTLLMPRQHFFIIEYEV